MLKSVNFDSSTSVYLQIENEVLFGVASGKLKPGDQLPPVQRLVDDLGVNPNTITKAYRDLQVMGIVNSRRGMGVFISKGIEAKCREQCRKDILGRLHEVVCEAKAAGMGAGEIKALTRACWASDASPYAETPAALLAAAKGGRK